MLRVRSACRANEVAVAAADVGLTADLEARIATLEALLAVVSLQDDGGTLRLTGVDLQIVNGEPGVANRRGNLIVGYNEPFDDSADDFRTGSHNVVVGPGHAYTSLGGLLAGRYNKALAPNATVVGGSENLALESASTVLGGTHNASGGPYAVVVGGIDNFAEGENAVVCGGDDNAARGASSVVAGGHENEATGERAVAVAGRQNEARGAASSVSGGRSRLAADPESWVAGSLFEAN